MKEVTLVLTPGEASNDKIIRGKASARSGIPEEEIKGLRYLHRSVDARRGRISVSLKVEVWTEEVPSSLTAPRFKWKDVGRSREVIIIGSGPAGLFAALTLIEEGIRPVILERGKEISKRKVDIARIGREHIIDNDSNYCFGEGGAGTFSDGKLYTRSKRRGDNLRVLELLVCHGANPDILFEAHPHIGTDKLPGVIMNIRNTITEAGGLVLFDHRVEDIIIKNGNVAGVQCRGGSTFISSNVILATGHSARDIYHLIRRKDIALEAKSFAMGVRVEHPQEMIDRIQYHGSGRDPFLPAAIYSLTSQIEGRGVYSFCMCPGGFIVPAATSDEEIVVNGMSPSGRNSPYANSGIVVEVRPEDIPAEYYRTGSLAGLMYQADIERLAWLNSERSQVAPAQRLNDFIFGRQSVNLPAVSYFPGVVSSPIHKWLPPSIAQKLKGGFLQFERRMKGFVTSEAVITAVESRTSSPVRIKRNKETLEHVEVLGLYPAGEGSGYAGGILSSSIDGIRVAKAIALKLASS
ncbi:MAG TPA: NAD(P)/FAD-dependent oxidoreductase [Bacteroidales bacterium]|nr:NAD(P)/FAD-dependent oxidoreductase [Bacteroidales bacterium]